MFPVHLSKEKYYMLYNVFVFFGHFHVVLQINTLHKGMFYIGYQ